MATSGFSQNTALPAPEPAGTLAVPFDRDKNFLIYSTGNYDIESAMDYYGLSYTIRSKNNPVTLNDLQTHDILIVGWNSNLNDSMSGLNSSVLQEGITGRVVLTGHDADFHVSHNPLAGNILFLETIKYVLNGGSFGMVAFGDAVNEFQWLPELWGVVAQGGFAEEHVESITQAGYDSGIYDDLTPQSLSDWDQSFHCYFESWGIGFKPFELGRASGTDVITIGTPINAKGILLTKEDDVTEGNCVSYEDNLNYTICYENISGEVITDVRIVDYLPIGVTYPEGFDTIDNNLNLIPADPNYDPALHTYTWQIGTISSDPNFGSGCVSLDVVVNEAAEPGMVLHNVAELIGTVSFEDPNSIGIVLAVAAEDTPVCCSDDPNIIYVDQYAADADSGTSWENAYNGQGGLSKALNRA